MTYKSNLLLKILRKAKNIFFKIFNEKIAIDILVRQIENIETLTKPIKIKILKADSQKRVSVFLSEIDFKYFYGGYFGMLMFAKLFHNNGYKVRIIITNNPLSYSEEWKVKIKKYKGLEDIFDIFEYESVYNRDRKYTFYENEELVATSWWTANITECVRKQLNKEKFIFFIQEFEPIFYESGSMYSLALESYTFPHYAVFSTHFLLSYFEKNSLGIFSQSGGKDNSVYFENAIVNLKPANNIAPRKTRKFLFYFRPESHAARNMFEIGFVALRKAIKDGIFQNEKWEFFGMGSFLSEKTEIPIYKDHKLRIIPKTNLEEYKKLIPEFDVGLSLMLSPHPSLVPFEMCSAGMNVVTNSFENKTKDEMKKISENFYIAEPSITSIKDAISEAVKDIENIEKRISGAKVNWPSNWDDTFNDDFKHKLFNHR